MKRMERNGVGMHLVVVDGLDRQLDIHSFAVLGATDRRRPEARIWTFMVLSAKSG